MRATVLLFMSLTVTVGLPVQDWESMESMLEVQGVRNPLLGDLLPQKGHVVQEDPKLVARKESFVQKKLAELQPVQQNEPVKAKSLVEDVLLVKKEEAEANEIDKGRELKEVPETPTEQMENIPLLNVMPETDKEDLTAEKSVMELEPIPEMQVYQRNLNDLMEEPKNREAFVEEERNVIPEEEKLETEEPVAWLEHVPKGQEIHDTNSNEVVEEPVIELDPRKEETLAAEEKNELQEELPMEAEEQVMGLEPVPEVQDINDMNPNEFVEDELMEPKDTLLEEEINAMQEEALLETSYLPEEVPVMELDPEGVERSAMLEEALMGSKNEMAEEPVFQLEPSQEFLMQDYIQEDRKNMEYLTEQLMLADQSYMEDSLMNEDLRNEEMAATGEEPVENEPSNLGWWACSGVVLNGKCYQFFRGPRKAADAEFFCQNYFIKGHLASVTSSYIHSHMMGLMDKNGGRTGTWIGGLRYLDTGRFIWLDGQRWGYADWLPGKPNNIAGVENCVELLSNGKFNNRPCQDLQAFICSYPY